MKTTPSTMSPVEAYEALMLFARRRGEGALRLAMHAAVPQSFRPDLLHLLKLNFLPRELHDPGTEADVLFSPLCEEVGRGYFEFGPHVRSLLLDNLAANYATDRTPRIARVANFLLFYVEHAERRNAGSLDRLRRDYLEVQRWVALAFLDPDDAARQLAEALRGTSTPGGEFAARLRLGGLASALSSPLVKYRHVLNYAAGLQALEAGDHARAQTLLSGLGDEELNVGGVRLRPASDLLRDYGAQTPEPAPQPPPQPDSSPEQTQASAPPRAPTLKARIYLSYVREDRERVLEFHNRLLELGHEPWIDFLSLQPGDDYVKALQGTMDEADFVIFFLSRNSSDRHGSNFEEEIDYALSRRMERPKDDIFLIPALLEPCEIPRPLARYQAVDLSAEGGWARLEEAIEEGLRRRGSRGYSRRERDEKIRDVEAAAGSDEHYALNALAETVWYEKDSRVRLTAVKALRKRGSERALELLLVATSDEDKGVRNAAVKALASVSVNAVLIFGFFGTDHVENLEVLHEELRRRGYVPLLFPFTRPPRPHIADSIRVAAQLSRFAVADLTAPPEIQDDLAAVLDLFLTQTRVRLVLISQGGALSERVLELRRRYDSVLPPHAYASRGELRNSFDRIIIDPVSPRPVEEPVEKTEKAAGKKGGILGTIRRWFDSVTSDETPDSEVPIDSMPAEPERKSSRPTRKESVRKSPARDKVFICYSHRDKRWLDRLRTHLAPLVRDMPLSVWDDTMILPGSEWRDEMAESLASAKVVVLLVSADFLASDFIAGDELFPPLEAAHKEGTTVLQLILSPSVFADTPIARYLAVNDPAKPLSALSPAEREKVLVKTCMVIMEAMKR